MIGEIIQEYLVSLGVQIDRPGFREMDRTIQESGHVVERATGAWAANFLRASTVIGSAIAGVTAAVGGLMNSAAQSDLEIQKFARNMMISKDAALEMKRATDALGESVNDILLTPELLDGFRQLTREGRQMKIGGDFEETMKHFRDLTFEFTRLKQEASYAMSWVGYYLMKYLQKPLNEIGEKFRRFNDSFIKNMSVWTEKVARSMVYIVNVGRHFLEFIWDVGKALYNVWDSFPKGAKIAAAAITGLWAIIRMSPLGRMIALVSTLLLLIDDYYGYMEGKDAAFGEYWDKLNGYIERGKQLWEEYKPAVMAALDTAVEWIILARDKVVEFAQDAKRSFDEFVNSQGFQEFIEISNGIVQAFMELGGGIVEAVTSLFGSFFDGMKDNGAGKEFSGLLGRIVGLFSDLYKFVGIAIRTVAGWFREISKSDTVREFASAIGELVAVVLELFNAVWDTATVALKELFGGFDDDKHAYSFRDALRAVVKMISSMVRTVSTVIRKLSEFFRLMKDNTIFRNFWKGLGGAVKEFTNLVGEALKTVGKLGQALILLTKGDFKGAKNLAGGALEDFGKRFFGTVVGRTNEEKIWGWLKANGISDVGSAAVLGNLRQESGVDFSTSASEDGSDFKIDGETGYGLVQWTSANRQRGLKDMADRMGKSVSDLEVQLEYMKKELQEYGLWEYLKQADDLREATRRFHDEYEGSNDYNSFGGIEHRQDFASDFYEKHRGMTYIDESTPRDPVQRTGGIGEGKYWIRQTNDVSIEGAQPQTLDALDLLGKWFYEKTGKPLVITSVTNGSSHTDGKYSHYAGWKIDANDWGSGAEGSFIDDYNMLRGPLADAFVAYGQSLGLGMNREKEGTDNVHFDISVAGEQWEGERKGENFGGLQYSNVDSSGQTQGVFEGINLPDMVDRALLEKFEEFVYVLRQNGYDIYTQSASRNSIGFTTSGEDWWNVRDMAEHYGMAATYDNNGGFYVSLPKTSAIQTSSIMPDYKIQPLGVYRNQDDAINDRIQDDSPTLAEIQAMVENGIITPIRGMMMPQEQKNVIPVSDFQRSDVLQKNTTGTELIIPIVESIREGFRGVSVSVPKIELPELPKTEMPKIEIPSIDIPEMKLERIAEAMERTNESIVQGFKNLNFPSVSVESKSGAEITMNAIVEAIKEGFRGVSVGIPNITMPELPKLDLPRLDIPEIPKINIPNIDMPELPEINLPKMEIPGLPEINLPEILPTVIQGMNPEQISGMLSEMANTMHPYMQEMASGLPQYVNNDNATTNNSTINNTIGDINVTVQGGANASAQEIARAARQEIFDRVQRDGNFLFGSRSLIGNMM